MILGPVFRSELTRTARRPRYYALRFLYGGILLALFWNGSSASSTGGSTGPSYRQAIDRARKRPIN